VDMVFVKFCDAGNKKKNRKKYGKDVGISHGL
jgi:hypothetical protein